MTPAEYKSLPANLQRDVRVALACGYGWERVCNSCGNVYVGNHIWRGDGPQMSLDDPDAAFAELRMHGARETLLWQIWQPTTDTTIWTALMDCGSGMHLSPYGCALWRANYGDGSPNTDLCGPTKGEAVCACFVAADPLGHLGRDWV